MSQRQLRRALACTGLLGLLALAAGAASAHDTWFESGPEGLALGTGAHYPRHETSVGPVPLHDAGCRSAVGTERLHVRRDTPKALLLALPRGAQVGPATCWAQLPPFDIELDDALVALYFDEIRATPAVRAARAEQRRRGLPWVERYVKHARVELGPPGQAVAPTPQPVAMGMDIVLESAAPREGDNLCFQVRRDGQALPGQAVQLASGRVAAGLWLQTDGAGRACVRVPLAGDWLLRGTELRPDPERADAWVSRFVTLAFRAQPR